MPNVLLVLVQTSVGLIEMFWVARLGTDALAGVSLVFPIVMLMQSKRCCQATAFSSSDLT